MSKFLLRSLREAQEELSARTHRETRPYTKEVVIKEKGNKKENSKEAMKYTRYHDRSNSIAYRTKYIDS